MDSCHRLAKGSTNEKDQWGPPGRRGPGRSWHEKVKVGRSWEKRHHCFGKSDLEVFRYVPKVTDDLLHLEKCHGQLLCLRFWWYFSRTKSQILVFAVHCWW